MKTDLQAAERRAREHWPEMLADLLGGPYAGHGGTRALAEAIGVTRFTVYYWRRGRRSPSWGYLQALARVWWLEFGARGED